ncbi:MAG: Tetratricopeptide 4, partial [Frankiales bacterium]|nr:Tetratricopeptide 4 [Frankiales bacterium]
GRPAGTPSGAPRSDGRPPTGDRRPPAGRGGGASRPERSGRSSPEQDRERLADRAYDPRREQRRQLARVPVPEGVDPRDLDPEVRQDLRTLAKDTADLTAQHLVMTGRLIDDDPEQALAHARAAGALAGRIGMVREAVGLAAYSAGEWAEALSELRAARRITGRADHLPVMADSERALGRPERALACYDDPDVGKLEQSIRVELAIVVAGARRDMGQADAAVLLLQGPARATTAKRPWAARLWYAYADGLLDAGRGEEAREWFAKAAEHDGQGETDALERLLELDGVVIEDLLDDDEDSAEGSWSVDSGTSPEGVEPPQDAEVAAPLLDQPEPERPATSAAPSADEPADEALASLRPEQTRQDAEPSREPGGVEDLLLDGPDAVEEPAPYSPFRAEPAPEVATVAPVIEPGRVGGVPFAATEQEEHVPVPPRTAVPGLAFVAAEDAEDAQPDAFEPELSEPELSEPDAFEPDAFEPEQGEPELSEPDESEQGSLFDAPE